MPGLARYNDCLTNSNSAVCGQLVNSLAIVTP